MSGLLDKANETAKAAENESPSIEAVVDVSEDEAIDKRILIGLQVVGIVALISSLFWLVQTGWLYATAMDYMIAIMLMLFGWVLYNGSDYISDSGLSNVKMLITAVAFVGLFVFTALGTMFMNAGGGVTIASVELDGKNDEIDLSFYGPSGMSYTIEVFVDGVVEYTHDDEIDRDRGSHSIALDEFWAGNAMDMNENNQVSYEIKVTSEDGEESFTFGDILNREIDTGFVKVGEVFWNDDDGTKEYTGITVEMILGIGDPDASFDFSNGFFTGTTPMPIESDWSATLTVKRGSSVEYQYSTIQANEGIVNGVGEFWFDWVRMPGTSAGDLAKDDFYSGDGCYTFEVEIVNVLGDTYTDSSSQIEFFWDSNEAESDPDNHQNAEAC